MKHFIFIASLTLMTGSAAMANTITQPHCNTGSICRSAMEENAVTHGIPFGTGNIGIGSSWGTGGPVQVGRPIAEAGIGCGNCNPVIGTPVVVDNNCALSQPESFVGHPIEITENYRLRMRVFSPDRMVGTMDYWLDRFNFFTDADGMITRVTCG